MREREMTDNIKEQERPKPLKRTLPDVLLDNMPRSVKRLLTTASIAMGLGPTTPISASPTNLQQPDTTGAQTTPSDIKKGGIIEWKDGDKGVISASPVQAPSTPLPIEEKPFPVAVPTPAGSRTPDTTKTNVVQDNGGAEGDTPDKVKGLPPSKVEAQIADETTDILNKITLTQNEIVSLNKLTGVEAGSPTPTLTPTATKDAAGGYTGLLETETGSPLDRLLTGNIDYKVAGTQPGEELKIAGVQNYTDLLVKAGGLKLLFFSPSKNNSYSIVAELPKTTTLQMSFKDVNGAITEGTRTFKANSFIVLNPDTQSISILEPNQEKGLMPSVIESDTQFQNNVSRLGILAPAGSLALGEMSPEGTLKVLVTQYKAATFAENINIKPSKVLYTAEATFSPAEYVFKAGDENRWIFKTISGQKHLFYKDDSGNLIEYPIKNNSSTEPIGFKKVRTKETKDSPQETSIVGAILSVNQNYQKEIPDKDGRTFLIEGESITMAFETKSGGTVIAEIPGSITFSIREADGSTKVLHQGNGNHLYGKGFLREKDSLPMYTIFDKLQKAKEEGQTRVGIGLTETFSQSYLDRFYKPEACDADETCRFLKTAMDPKNGFISLTEFFNLINSAKKPIAVTLPFNALGAVFSTIS